jgi:hypothetical protein
MKSSCWSVLASICLGMVMLLVIDVSMEAQTLPPDVGLVTRLSGDVTCWNEGDRRTAEQAQAFMRIRRGDHFKVTTGAMVQLVYFQNGRKETWKGPVAFETADAESRVQDGKGRSVEPEVNYLPAGASQGMRRIPGLLRRAGLSRSGATQARGIDRGRQEPLVLGEKERSEIAAAKTVYQSLRRQAPEDDITPELNLLAVLADYEQFEEMEEILQEALKRQSDNPVLIELKEWTHRQGSKLKAR